MPDAIDADPASRDKPGDAARRDDVLRRMLTTARKLKERVQPLVEAAAEQVAVDHSIIARSAEAVAETRAVIDRSKDAIEASQERLGRGPRGSS